MFLIGFLRGGFRGVLVLFVCLVFWVEIRSSVRIIFMVKDFSTARVSFWVFFVFEGRGLLGIVGFVVSVS